MPKVKISEYSATANSNTDVASINIDEGCAPSGINNAIRAVMGHLKDFQQGTNGDPFNGPVNGTLGATTASTVAATTLTTSSTVTHNGGTANGVAYLNGSKVLTTGSALVFDGTNLGLGVTPSAWNTAGGAALQIKNASLISYGNADVELAFNSFFNGTNYKYIANGFATRYDQVSGTHAWFNAASGTAGNTITFTQAMTLNASGNLGIGTTAPLGKLHVSASGLSTIYMSDTGEATDQKNWTFQYGTGVGTGTFRLRALNDANNSGQNAYIITRTGIAVDTHQWLTADTERARIDSSGNLLVGTTSVIDAGAQGVQIKTTTSTKWVLVTSSPDRAWIANTTQASGTSYYAYFNYNTSNVGAISSTGTVTVYSTTSDYRLKTVHGALTGYGERIDALKPISYEWKNGALQDRGFLAHEFQIVYPNSVTGEKDALDADGKPVYQAMQAGTSEVIADLVAEIQSLRKRLAALESN